MTVAALPSTISYLENGATMAFALPFRFKTLRVTRFFADGSTAVLAEGVDYTTTGGDTDGGGTLTVTAAAASGTRLVVQRSTPRAQTMAYTTNDRFPAASHEGALDTAMLIDQEQDDILGDLTSRALLAPVTVAPYVGLFPTLNAFGDWVFTPAGPGATGPANSTFGSIPLMQAAPFTNRSFLLATTNLAGLYASIPGNFTGQIDGATVIALNDTSIAAGALVRVDTMRQQFPTAQGGTDDRGVVHWLDAARGRQYMGGTEYTLTNDEGGYWDDWMAEVGHTPSEYDQGPYSSGRGRASFAVAGYDDAGGHNSGSEGVAGFVRGAGSHVGAAVAARFTGSISGTTLTVTDLDWGTIANGKVIKASGVTPGTTIVGQLTSAATDVEGNAYNGAEGTYQVSLSQTVSSRVIKLGTKADATAAFLGYAAAAIGKTCQAVGEKAVAMGEGALAWGRANVAMGYLAKAWRGIGVVALGYRVDVKGDGMFGIGGRIKAWYASAIGTGVNDGSPLANTIRGTLAIGMRALRGTVRFWPGAPGDSYTGWVGSYSGWHGVGDIGSATDIDFGSITWPVVNTGGGGTVDGLLTGLKGGVITPFLRIDGVAKYPEFFGDRLRLGTARTIATSGSAGVTGEMCWDANFIYLCTATNTWHRIAWTSSSW